MPPRRSFIVEAAPRLKSRASRQNALPLGALRAELFTLW
jgi:hypothetical protein